jgi:hypothetical protein
MQILVIIKCPEKAVEKYGICVVGSKKFTSASEKKSQESIYFSTEMQRQSDSSPYLILIFILVLNETNSNNSFTFPISISFSTFIFALTFTTRHIPTIL